MQRPPQEKTTLAKPQLFSGTFSWGRTRLKLGRDTYRFFGELAFEFHPSLYGAVGFPFQPHAQSSSDVVHFSFKAVAKTAQGSKPNILSFHLGMAPMQQATPYPGGKMCKGTLRWR